MGIPRHGEAQPVDEYLMLNHWCFHIYSYRAVLEIDGEPYEIRPGMASLIPPGTRMVYRYIGTSEHVYFHFRVPPSESGTNLPIIFELGVDFPKIDDRARQAVRRLRDNPYPRAVLWELLCEMAEREHLGRNPNSAARHPTVDMALLHIEQRLAGSFTVAQLCQEVGVSYGYLGRLFKQHLGKSVLDYIRERRADHAEHLIVSTKLPLKVIARAVGSRDLQQFNRLMRRTKGASPRVIRELGHSVTLE